MDVNVLSSAKDYLRGTERERDRETNRDIYEQSWGWGVGMAETERTLET